MILEDYGTQQETCPHLSWEKVEAVDELYWRCLDCGATASTNDDLTEKHDRQSSTAIVNRVDTKLTKHTHKWVLVDTYDSWKLPEPIYSPFADDYRIAMLEIIASHDEPHRKHETWVCSCGKEKTNYHESKSFNEILHRGEQS